MAVHRFSSAWLVLLTSITLAAPPAPPGAAGAVPCEEEGLEPTRMGTEGNDQIWGTSENDVLFGLGGRDDIKGLGGDDIICGGDGDDGINGGKGADRIGGGRGADLLVGGGGPDELSGGPGDGDGLFGGHGADTLVGDDDSGPDYLAGGPDGDTLRPGNGDEAYPSTQGDTDCPSLFSAWIGAYGGRKRLSLAEESDPCMTVTGKIRRLRYAKDGDRKFHLKGLIVEFMPRDVGKFPDVSPGTGITVTGLHVFDSHGNEEIHPVFKVVYKGDPYFSGPRYAGSPEAIRPGNLVGLSESRRYCWNQFGVPCRPWNPEGAPFH